MEYAAFLAAYLLLRPVPIRVAFFISRIIARFFYILDARHRKRTIKHIMHAGLAETEEKAIPMAKENFRHFARLAVEILKMPGYINPDSIEKHIRISGSEKAKKLFFEKGADGKAQSPAIVVTAHFGNWEIAGISYNILSGIPLLTVMRPLDNPKIGNFLYQRRQGFNHRICDKSGAVKPLLSALKKGESVCIISDQHASRTEGVETSFFGHPARTHSSPAMLHRRTAVPILVSVPMRTEGVFQFEFLCADPIMFTPTDNKEKDIREITQSLTSALEKLIRHDPAQWLWAHRRWLDVR